ncbi:MAG TPA: HutD family protein, partial [Synergistales bacterium]|nr:HutD family protein [Synergistales bacterium]
MRVIRRTPPDYRTMPWKNGGGITHEMFIYPEDATLQEEEFLWRLSSANVGESGPFSTFPGYDRVLFFLSGNALDLTVNGETVSLRSPFDSL